MKFNLFLSCFFLFQISKAQLANLQGTFQAPLRDVVEGKKISGDRYLFASYKSGLIYESNGQTHQVFLKYDMYKDEVEVYNNDEALILTKVLYPSFKFDFFDDVLNSRRVVNFKSGFKVDGFKKDNYFEVLIENRTHSFIKSNRVSLEEITTSEYGGKNEVQSKYVKRNRYFLCENNGSFIEVRNKKSEIFKSFEGSKDLLNAYIKANKLKFKTESDLIKLITYYLEINS